MLVNWSGKMTGIQRVEYNLASRFAKEKNVKFFVFDKSTNRLIDFDFKHIEYKITSQQNLVDATSQQAQPPVLVSKSLTSRVHGKAKDILRPLYHKVRGGTRRVLGSNSDTRQRALIAEGDTILILSGDWSDGAFMSLMEEYKTRRNARIIQVIYDMLPYVHSSYFIAGMPEQFSNYMLKALSISEKALAISQSTKRDIEKFMKDMGLAKIPVDVFRLGDDFVKETPEKPVVSNEQLVDGFLLTVGTVETRKNHRLILDSYIEAQRQGIQLPSIVLAGKKGWLIEEFMAKLSANPSVKEKFVFLQPTDKELAWLYKNCIFTIFPSIYEGWGLPVAESLFNGKLCLSSNSSSMPEIAGDMIDYFSPSDPKELLEKISFYLANKNRLRSKEREIARYKPTSWDDSFAQVKALVKE